MAKSRNPNGQGTYFKRGKYYCWKIKIDKEVKEFSAKTPKELQAKINDFIDLPIIKNKCRVSEWFEPWLENYVKLMKKPATYEQYNYLYTGHVKPILGKKLIIDVKTTDIQGVIANMNKRNMAAKTMKHVKSIMHLGFEQALRESYIAINPVKNIEIPKKQPKTQKVLTPDEIQKLLKSLENSRWIHSVRFMLVTGLRRGEMLALKWSNIDYSSRKITIEESNSKSGIGDTKSAKVHYVSLTDKAITYLADQMNQLKKEHNPILVVEKLQKSDLVFPGDTGEVLKPNSYYTLIRRAALKAEIHVSPHCFRHTFVYMMRKILSLKELQDALGHDESTTTLDIYGDMINDNIESSTKKMNDVFKDLDLQVKEIEEKKQAKVIQFPKAK